MPYGILAKRQATDSVKILIKKIDLKPDVDQEQQKGTQKGIQLGIRQKNHIKL